LSYLNKNRRNSSILSLFAVSVEIDNWTCPTAYHSLLVFHISRRRCDGLLFHRFLCSSLSYRISWNTIDIDNISKLVLYTLKYSTKVICVSRAFVLKIINKISFSPSFFPGRVDPILDPWSSRLLVLAFMWLTRGGIFNQAIANLNLYVVMFSIWFTNYIRVLG